MGKPVIATDVLGYRDIVQDQITGFLTPVQNPGALSEAMIKMILLPKSARVEIGKNAKRRVMNFFSDEVICEQLVLLTDETISRSSGQGISQ